MRTLVIAAILAGSTPAVFAQLTGTIEGMVTDPSHQAISGAQVAVQEVTTNTERRLASDPEGHYEAADLPPGNYRARFSAPAFQPAEESGLIVTAGKTLRADVELRIGEARESVAVTADTEQVDAAAGAWGDSLFEQQLSSLPLNGRDLFELASQETGTIKPADATQNIGQGPGIHLSINGSRPSENSFRLDGIYIGDSYGTAPASVAGILLGLETISEVRVVTSPFSAEYGRSDGGVITAVSRTGTNDFHGSAYEYLLNSALDAKNFFDPAGKIPPLRRNQFGALFDGPLVKNRLFFLLNYEGVRIDSNVTDTSSVPDAQARQGILPVNGVPTHVTVVSSVIPYLKLYPMPNGPETGNGIAEYIAAVPSITGEDYGTARLDYVASDRWHIGGRYTQDAGTQTTHDPFGEWTFPGTSHYTMAHLTAQFIESPSVIHEFRAAFSQVDNRQVATLPDALASQLSFVPGLPMGEIAVVGLTDFGGLTARNQPREFEDTDGQTSYSQTRIRGIQKLSFGAGFDRIWFDEIANLDQDGYYQFSSLQNFLAGKARSVSLMLPGSSSLRHWRYDEFSAYLQDDLRLTSRLSIGAGVRYETATTPVERNGLVATLPNPQTDSSVTLGGPLFVNPSHWNFAPRLSLAWDVFGDGHTVIRAGSGIFYDLLGTRELIIAGLRMPPFYYRAVLSNAPFPDALAAVKGALPPPSVDGLDYRPNQPRTLQYQFAIEHAMGRDTVVQAGYTGLRGIHLVGDVDNLNTPVPQYLPDGQLYFSPTAPLINPAFGEISMRLTNFDSNYQALNLGLRASPLKGLLVQSKFTWSKSIDDDSDAIYSDFFTSAELPNVFDYRDNRAVSDFDCPFVFATNFTWQLPRTGNRGADVLLGGWELDGLVQAQSGDPFNPTVGFDNANLRGTSTDLGQRPNLVPGVPIVTGNPAQYFNPLAFSLPAAGTLGNLGRNTLTGPGLVILSTALERTFWHTERQSLRVRAEAFNLANHPNLQVPSGLALFDSTGARLGTAGQITATTTTSRQLQLSARYSF